MPQLDQDDGQVVHEEQRVHEADGEPDETLEHDALELVDDVVGVEEPEGDEEDQGEDADEGAVHVDAGQGGAGWPEEDGPRAHGQDHELEGQGDDEAVALHAASQLVVAEVEHVQGGQGHHEDGADEGQEGQEAGKEVGGVTAAAEGHAAVGVEMPFVGGVGGVGTVDLAVVHLGRGGRDGRVGLAPIFGLKRGKKRGY